MSKNKSNSIPQETQVDATAGTDNKLPPVGTAQGDDAAAIAQSQQSQAPLAGTGDTAAAPQPDAGVAGADASTAEPIKTEPAPAPADNVAVERTFEAFLRKTLKAQTEAGKSVHVRLVPVVNGDDVLQFYAHPYDLDGETVTYIVEGDTIKNVSA